MSKKDEAGQQYLEISKRFKSSFLNTVIIIMVVMINTHVICRIYEDQNCIALFQRVGKSHCN